MASGVSPHCHSYSHPVAETERQPTIPADAKAEEHLFEVVTAVFVMAIGRAGGPRHPRGILIGALERHGWGVLRQPRCQEGVPLQRRARDSSKHTLEMRHKQRIKDVSSPVIRQ